MSGDVQPRKRKDKKKKKDDLGIEEPRGTAAALGDGDIFMHSHHDHGTGGHWCAKVIFFGLLAVLVTLVGLIILENRGLSELEANSVESRYSGVLEGWLEEGNDHHHDEHTLELKHHDNEGDEHDSALEHEDDDDESEELNHDDDDGQNQDEDEDNEQTQEEEDDAENQDDDDEQSQEDDDDDDEEEQNQDDEAEDYVQYQDDDDYDGDNEENQDSNEENEQEQDEAYQKDANFQEALDDDSEEQNLEMGEDEDDIDEKSYRRYYRNTDNQIKDDGDGEDDEDLESTKNDQSAENNDENEVGQQNYSKENEDNERYDNNDSHENDDDDDQHQLNDEEENDADEDDDDHEDHNDRNEDDEVELEHIEEEVFDEDASKEAHTRELEDSEEVSREASPEADKDEDEIELLEPDDSDELPEELPIPMPKGKPLIEVDDTPSTERPQDTLADEEEYERQQEALRKEKEEASQGMWLKLVVGGALLVATQAVLRRATAPRDNEDEVDSTREDTPLSDRRMTLIAEPVPPPVVPKPVLQKEVVRQAPMVKSAPPPLEDEDEEEDAEIEEEEEEIVVTKNDENVAAEKDKELYSDEEDEEEDAQEIELPKPITPIKESQKTPISKPTTSLKMPPKPPVTELTQKKEPPKEVKKEPTPEDEDDDVEIIEDEDLEEEEEDISDVDDAELLNRLEAKYGRLPEPGRQKDGGNSIEDEWPGEPSDAYWREELDGAERDLRQGDWTSAVERAGAAVLRSSARARYIIAKALDLSAEAKRDNSLLSKAIAAYLELLKMNEKLTDKKLLQVTERALDRMKFRGNYLATEPMYRLLFRRFPNDANHRNNLTISFLMANRVDLAEEVLKETLKLWPNDRLALAHHGFILKTRHNKQEEAVDAFMKALEGDTGPANEPRYYYHLGDSLLLLGRFKEAEEVHKRGAKLGHFLSPFQRSLYNVERLKSQPWWDVEKTPYSRLARALEKSYKDILKEGRSAQALYEKEKEGLKEKGEWSQLDLFARGREVEGRCARAPVTCGIVRSETAASGCRRGQIKFSLMEAGTHVRPHVGPTNCRLRMHLGLSNTKDTYIRVNQEIRQWQTGKVLMFDDSFEHEVWHNGTGARLVLIVDVWHPDLTRAERTQLPAI